MNRQPQDDESRENVPVDETTPGTTRRDFLKIAGVTAAGAMLSGTVGSAAVQAAAAASALPSGKANVPKLKGARIAPRVPMAKGSVLGANDRLQVGIIGVGGQGGSHLYLLNARKGETNVEVIGCSDVYNPRLERARGAIEQNLDGRKAIAEKDYRALLDNKDLDAVVIATPEHWHAQAAIDAMTAGKHVYVEKPFTRYLDEAYAVEKVVQSTGKVFQVGSQGCSEARWHVAGDAVRAGKIGPLVSCQGSYARNSTGGEWNYHIDQDASLDNLDWKMWLGTAPDRPWNEDSKARFFRYRKYRDYSGGLIGDLLPHKLHPLMITAFGDKPQFPKTVTALGTMKISTDREVADTIHVLSEFENGLTMYVYLSTVNEQGIDDVIRGHKGTLRFGGNRVQLSPERAYAEEIDQEDLPVNDPGENMVQHQKSWLNAIRTGSRPACPIDLAICVQTIVSLAEMSEVFGKTMHFDPKTRKYNAV